MKNKLLIIIAVFLVPISGIGSWTGTAAEMPDSIDGFVISNPQGDVRQYPIDKLDEIPCEDFMSTFHPEMLKTEQRTLISEKLTSCLKDSSGHTVTYENTPIPQVPFCDEIYSDETHSGICVKRKVWEVQILGGGPIDMDPDLSPSYALDFGWYGFLIPMIQLISLFTLPYIPLWLIEKYKKIPARSLQKLFLAATAIYFGGTFSITLLIGVITLIFNQGGNFGMFGSFMFTFGLLGIPVLALGIVLLYKSPIIRRLLKK